MSDNQTKHRSDADAALEREIRDGRKFTLAEAIGRLLYLVHLAVLLWWLLDKSSKQRATTALVSLFQQVLPSAGMTLRLPPVRRFVISADELLREALFSDVSDERSTDK